MLTQMESKKKSLFLCPVHVFLCKTKLDGNAFDFGEPVIQTDILAKNKLNPNWFKICGKINNGIYLNIRQYIKYSTT